MLKTILYIFIFIFVSDEVKAQELFPFTEPASNMPSNTIIPKIAAYLSPENSRVKQRYVPEIMFGISKKFMVHAGTSFSNMHTKNSKWDGGYVYGKYRFLSKDAVHEHFRMATFITMAYSKSPLHYDDINFMGDNSGGQIGIIVTQLKNKFAISGSVSYLKTVNNGKESLLTDSKKSALNYSLSTGYLVVPKEYVSFDQLNINVYTEFLAQQNVHTNKYYIDAAPAIQAIIKSNSKLNFGYRFQVKGNQFRNMKNSFLLSFEYTFYNVLKRK
jgi:hypothetical protein